MLTESELAELFPVNERGQCDNGCWYYFLHRRTDGFMAWRCTYCERAEPAWREHLRHPRLASPPFGSPIQLAPVDDDRPGETLYVRKERQ